MDTTPPAPNQSIPLHPLRDAGVQEQTLKSEVLLYQQAKGRVGVLNRTAYFVWQRCDGRHTVHEIGVAVRASFAATEEHDVDAEVSEALGSLCAAGLIVAAGETGEPRGAA